MADIPKTYASPGLRWGLFRHDHPNAPDPVYSVVTGEVLGIPPEFAGGEGQDFSGVFILCTVDPADGSPLIEAWKEVPNREHTRNGTKDFARTPENWRKLQTQALGRAMKAAGYPDDTEDLKALLLWRRRSIELEMLAAGGPLAELGTGSAPLEEQLERAARPTPDADHEEIIEGDSEDSRESADAAEPAEAPVGTARRAERPSRGGPPSSPGSAPTDDKPKRVKPAWVKEFQAKADAAGVTDKDRREIARSISDGRTESPSALLETEAAAAERALATVIEELVGSAS